MSAGSESIQPEVLKPRVSPEIIFREVYADENQSLVQLNDGKFLHTVSEGYTLSANLEKSIEIMRAVLDEATEKKSVDYTVDITTTPKITIDEVIQSSSLVLRGEEPPFRHPALKVYKVVTQNKLILYALEGYRHPVFGEVKNIVPFKTVEEALAA